MTRFQLFKLPLYALLAFALSGTVALAEEGFKPLFDGSLKGWDGDTRFWRAEGGSIVGETTPANPTPGNTFLIWRNGDLDDFELKLEYRLRGGNSGVQVRSFENEKEWGKWVIGGYQADMEAGDRFSGIIYGERYRGVLADRGQKTVIGKDHKPSVVGKLGDPKELGSFIKKEDWNEYRIVGRGNRIAVEINGHATAETTDEDETERRRSGLLALQLHAGPPMKVEFRNIQLKRLKLEDRKKVVLVAGKPSHGYGAHEHNAGCLLLQKGLKESGLPVLAAVYKNGWPADPTAFDNADALVMYSDGGDGHMVVPHQDEVAALMKKGVGMACIHYAVEPPGSEGLKEKAWKNFLDWIGGYFEIRYSVNPHWTADFQKFPQHPITSGVKPFKINDEWYYGMRFPEGMEGVRPILEAVPPESTRNGQDGTHSGNAHVRSRKGMSETVAWARERTDGGRGFGFTGGHDHWNWGNDDFRKLVLNALVWIAHGEVPPEGVVSKPLSRADLEANQDEPKPESKT